MPELPDLEIICEFLSQRIVNTSIVAAKVNRPIVIRNLLGGDAAQHLVGRRFVGVARRGKFLLLALDTGLHLVINPMLAGRIHYGAPLARIRKRDVLILTLDNELELRYHDAKDMGKLYLTRDLAQVPAFDSLGPEATDPELTLNVFRQRLKKERGEIKRVISKQSFVAGIGNAYADEICWRAGTYPFRRRSTLTDDEVEQLYTAMRSVLAESIETLRTRVTDRIDREIRDFLSIHGKSGEPCPICGSAISKVRRERRETNFCRTCQPGLMIKQ
jgi:formamidopyrimidine-DNA glycosylase